MNGKTKILAIMRHADLIVCFIFCVSDQNSELF